jgi:hypothetical protein
MAQASGGLPSMHRFTAAHENRRRMTPTKSPGTRRKCTHSTHSILSIHGSLTTPSPQGRRSSRMSHDCLSTCRRKSPSDRPETSFPDAPGSFHAEPSGEVLRSASQWPITACQQGHRPLPISADVSGARPLRPAPRERHIAQQLGQESAPYSGATLSPPVARKAQQTQRSLGLHDQVDPLRR